MPNEAAVDKATMLRGDGANYGQTGFATGAAYFEIVFQIGNVDYTAHREKLVPSIRKIWL